MARKGGRDARAPGAPYGRTYPRVIPKRSEGSDFRDASTIVPYETEGIHRIVPFFIVYRL